MLNQFFSLLYLTAKVVAGEHSSVAKLIFTLYFHISTPEWERSDHVETDLEGGESQPLKELLGELQPCCVVQKVERSHNEALWLLARYTLWNEFQNKVLDYRRLFQAIAGMSTTVEKLWHQQLGIEEPEILRETCQAELKISKYFS